MTTIVVRQVETSCERVARALHLPRIVRYCWACKERERERGRGRKKDEGASEHVQNQSKNKLESRARAEWRWSLLVLLLLLVVLPLHWTGWVGSGTCSSERKSICCKIPFSLPPLIVCQTLAILFRLVIIFLSQQFEFGTFFVILATNHSRSIAKISSMILLARHEHETIDLIEDINGKTGTW
jgi:hypothetical protein